MKTNHYKIIAGLFLMTNVGLACGDGPSFVTHPDLAWLDVVEDEGGATDFSGFVLDIPQNRDESGTDGYTTDNVGDDLALDPDLTAAETLDDDGYEDGQDADDQDSYINDVDADEDDAETPPIEDTGVEGDVKDTVAYWDPGYDPGTDSGTLDDGPLDNGPDAGYTGIYEGTGDLTGAELVNAICPLVRNGYHTVSYDNSKDYLREDVDPYNGRIFEIYTGKWMNPEDRLVNVEHSWPQSKGADSSPMQGDMYHLFLSDSHYNSARSNYPFGTATDKDWPTNDADDLAKCDFDCIDRWQADNDDGCCSWRGYDSAGVRVFEPRDSHKGNVARAIFYFSLRYGGSNCALKPLGDFDETYGHDVVMEAVLKEWNRKDPPDDYERTRNDRIQAIENVRNPFVDHPEFVDRIDFTP